MSPDAAWKTLKIDATEDVRAIRSAYARVLKAIDVEADPKAFIVLRTAFELATALAKGERHVGEFEPFVSAESEEAGGASFDDDFEPEPPPPPDPVEQAFAEIENEVFDRSDTLDTARLRASIGLLVAPETIEQLDAALDIEARLLEIIRIGYPRAEPVIGPAIRAFGWDTREFPSDDVKWALALHRDTVFLDRHPELEPAYRALEAPFTPPGRWRERLLADQIDRLFDRADARWPHLAEELDPDAWQWWRARRGRPRLRVRDLLLCLGVGIALMVTLYILDFGAGTFEGPLLLVSGSLTALGFAAWRASWWRRDGGFTFFELFWTLVSLGLPLVAVLNAPSPKLLIGLGLASAAATVLAGRRPEPVLTGDERQRRITGPLAAIVAWEFLVGLADARVAAVGFIPVCAAAATAWAVYPRVGAWLDGSADRRSTAALLVTIGGGFVCVLLFIAGDPLVMAALALLLLVQHLLTGREEVTMLLHWQTWATLALAWLAGANLIEAPPGPATLRTLALMVAVIPVYRSTRLLFRWL